MDPLNNFIRHLLFPFEATSMILTHSILFSFRSFQTLKWPLQHIQNSVVCYWPIKYWPKPVLVLGMHDHAVCAHL